MRFFYGGPNLDRVLCEGFSELDLEDPFSFNTYGRGLYFSPFFSKAHFFSQGSGTVLLALVGLGKSETVVSEDPKRGRPSKGYDSVCVPGRQLPLTSALDKGPSIDDAMEDYIIFHPAQALP